MCSMQSECCEERASTIPQWPWEELSDDFPGDAFEQLWCIDTPGLEYSDVRALAVAADGRVALCISDPPKLVCYAPSGMEAHAVDISLHGVSLAFATDGRLALTSVVQKEQVFSRIAVLSTAYEERWSRQIEFGSWSLIFSQMTFAVDGRLAWATTGNSGTLILIYSATGEVVAEVKQDGGLSPVCLAVGTCYSCICQGTSLYLYGMSGEIVLRQRTSSDVTAVAFGPGDCLASGSSDLVTFWNNGGAKSHDAELGHSGQEVRQLVYLDDGHLIACGHDIAIFGPSGQMIWRGRINVYDALSGNGQYAAKIYPGKLMCCRLGAYGRLHRVHINTSPLARTTSVALAMDGRVAAVTTGTGRSGLIYNSIGEEVWAHHYDQFLMPEDEAPLSCTILRNGHSIFVTDKSLTIFDVKQQVLVRRGEGGGIRKCAIAEDGQRCDIALVVGAKTKMWQTDHANSGNLGLKWTTNHRDTFGSGLYGSGCNCFEWELWDNMCSDGIWVTALAFALGDKVVHAWTRMTGVEMRHWLAFHNRSDGKVPVDPSNPNHTWEIHVSQRVCSLIGTGGTLACGNVTLARGNVSGEITLFSRNGTELETKLHRSGTDLGQIALADVGRNHFASADDCCIVLWSTRNRTDSDSDLRRVAMFPIVPEARPGPPLCISSPADDDARLVVGTPTDIHDILVFNTEMYPLALLWKPVTAWVAAGSASCEELFECSPLLLAQPIPVVQYTLLHWFVRKDKVDAFKYLSGLCIKKKIWGGLEKTVDGNLLDFAVETRNHDMIRAVLDYLSHTPVWGLLMQHWKESIEKLVVDLGSDAFALGLGELLESRLVLPRLSGGLDGPEQLPTSASLSALRVVGSLLPSLGQTQYRNSIAPAGDTKISLRALFLPDFQQVWQVIAGLPSVPDAVILSTVYRASLQQSWESYGSVANVRTGIFLLFDVISFSVFAVVTAEHASDPTEAIQSRPMSHPRMVSAPWDTVVRKFVGAPLLLQAVWPLLLQLFGAIYQHCRCNQLPDLTEAIRSMPMVSAPRDSVVQKFVGAFQAVWPLLLHPCGLICGLIYYFNQLPHLPVRVVFRRCSCVISRCRRCCCKHRCGLHCEWLGWRRYLDRWETPFSLFRTVLAAGVLLSSWHPLWLVTVSGLRAMQWEVRAICRQGWKYWRDAWNFLDWFALLLCTGLPVLVLLEIVPPKKLTPYLSITIVLLWIRFISFLRAYRSFGHLIQMIQATTKAMVPFIMLMFIVLVGLSCGWAVLAIANPDSHFLQEEDSIHCTPTDDASDHASISCGSGAQTFQNAGWQLFASFTLMYRLTMLGDFPGDAFALADFSGNPDDSSPQWETAWIAWLFFGFGTLFFLVVLLNLLIAIIGDKYDEIQLRAEPEFLRQRSRICLEAHALELHPRPLQEPYLVMVFPKQYELGPGKGGMKTDLGDEWEGRCKALERMFRQQEGSFRKVLEDRKLAEKQIISLQDRQLETHKVLEDQGSVSKQQIESLLDFQSKQSKAIDGLRDALSKQSEQISALASSSMHCNERLEGQVKTIEGLGRALDKVQFSIENVVAAKGTRMRSGDLECPHSHRQPRDGTNDSNDAHCQRQSHNLPQPLPPLSANVLHEQHLAPPVSSPAIGNSPEHQLHGKTTHRNLPQIFHGSQISLHTHGQHSHGRRSHVQMASSESGSDGPDAHGQPPDPSTAVPHEHNVAPRMRQINDNSSPLRQQSCDAGVQPSAGRGSMPREQHGAQRRRRSQRPIKGRSSADNE